MVSDIKILVGLILLMSSGFYDKTLSSKKSGTVNSPQSLWQSLPEILMSPESAPNGKHSGKGNPRISGTLRPSQPGNPGLDHDQRKIENLGPVLVRFLSTYWHSKLTIQNELNFKWTLGDLCRPIEQSEKDSCVIHCYDFAFLWRDITKLNTIIIH